jgi:hypothetical protein
MSFNKLIKTAKTPEVNTASWLSEPIPTPILPPVTTAKVIEIDTKKSTERWSYQGIKKETVKHVFTWQLSKAKDNHIDIHNWIETIIMFIELNGKYVINEFQVPDQFIDILGAKTIWTSGYQRTDHEEIIWMLKK